MRSVWPLIIAASSEAMEGAGEVGGYCAGQVPRLDAPAERLRPPDLLEVLLGVAFLRARAPGQAGRDGVDRDAAGPEFHRQGAGEAHHGALAGDVGDEPGARRLPHRVGGHVDDAAEAAVGHAGRERGAQLEGGLDVDRLNPPPGLQVELAERAEEHQPRAVDQHVASPEAAGDLADQQRDTAGRAEVALHREHLFRARGAPAPVPSGPAPFMSLIAVTVSSAGCRSPSASTCPDLASRSAMA
ncbi:MAG TPA: hypothetical protein VGF32_30020 [Streptosporangiaceae bacterium]